MTRITSANVLKHVILWPVLFWLSVSTAVADTRFPDIFPATPATKTQGCPGDQTAYLQEAWRLAL
jgi:hypothetical protein